MVLPTAYVSITIWKKDVILNYYIVYVDVTVTENASSGPPIVGVTVQGTWSGGYGGTVSGTTNASGVAGTWQTVWVPRGSWVSFTVNKITTGSSEYELTGQTSASIGI